MNPLLKYKEKSGKTWLYFENLTGISRISLQKYARGIHKMRLDTAEKICSATKLDIKDLKPIVGKNSADNDLFNRKAAAEKRIYPASEFHRDAVTALFRVLTCPRNFARITHQGRPSGANNDAGTVTI